MRFHQRGYASSARHTLSVVTAAETAATFVDLGLPDVMVEVLANQEILRPTEIQEAVIPDLLDGRDVLGQAPTGSGKTLGFGVPLLMTVARADPRKPRGLVLAPTRELAAQIQRDLRPVAKAVGRRVVAVYGGVPMEPQVKSLRAGVDVVVATPGRLADLIRQGELSLDAADRVVVDEADRMADMGFLPSVRELLDLTSPHRQTMLFSATLDDAVAELIADYQQHPVRHSVGTIEPDLTLMTHRFVRTTSSQKVPLAASIIKNLGPTMVFCRTRHGVDRVYRELRKAEVHAGWIHGGRTQKQRDHALMAFTDGRVQALVATDVAARGIHVDNVACVIHFDPPADAKDYVHRSGRTARAGASGAVYLFVNQGQLKVATSMAAEIGLSGVEVEEAAAALAVVDHPADAPPESPKLAPKAVKKGGRSGKPRAKNRKKTGTRGTGAAPKKSARRGTKALRAGKRRSPKKRKR